MLDRAEPKRPYFADSEIKVLLATARIKQSFFVSVLGRYGVFIVCLIGCVVTGWLEQRWLLSQEKEPGHELLPNGTQVATAMLTLVAAFFAFYQWADARREASLEKFYERLKLTNDRYADWPHARKLVDHFWEPTAAGAAADLPDPDFQRRMYVFLELDNLEYMVIRWERGFARQLLMGRAMRTFASRCESSEFRRLALQLVKGSGYMVGTRKLAKVLAKRGKRRAGRVHA